MRNINKMMTFFNYSNELRGLSEFPFGPGDPGPIKLLLVI